MPADLKRRAEIVGSENRRCSWCGCTEQKACVIQVVVASADGSSQVAISRGCSWSRNLPQLCTACEALHGGNTDETEILFDLFPVEFNTAAHLLKDGARQRSAQHQRQDKGHALKGT
jgi:hypothetical protein